MTWTKFCLHVCISVRHPIERRRIQPLQWSKGKLLMFSLFLYDIHCVSGTPFVLIIGSDVILL